MLEGVYTDMQKKIFSKDWLRYNAPVLVCLAAILILIFLPTGFEGAVDYQGTERVRAEVLSVDNSTIVDTGLVRSGEQRCRLRIEEGMFKGVEADGVNMLNGSLEQDKIFYPGDQAMVVVSHQGDSILTVTMTDHYRLNWELVMGAAFAVFLILFAGKTGLRARLRADHPLPLETAGALLPAGLEPDLAGAGDYPLPHRHDHRPGLRV